MHWRWVRENKGNYYYDSNNKPDLLIQTWRADFTMFDEPGTPTINNINLESPAFGSGEGSNVLCGGTLTLLAVQPFILGSSGNIVAAASTRAAGAVVRLRYVNPLRKWIEV